MLNMKMPDLPLRWILPAVLAMTLTLVIAPDVHAGGSPEPPPSEPEPPPSGSPPPGVEECRSVRDGTSCESPKEVKRWTVSSWSGYTCNAAEKVKKGTLCCNRWKNSCTGEKLPLKVCATTYETSTTSWTETGTTTYSHSYGRWFGVCYKYKHTWKSSPTCGRTHVVSTTNPYGERVSDSYCD